MPAVKDHYGRLLTEEWDGQSHSGQMFGIVKSQIPEIGAPARAASQLAKSQIPEIGATARAAAQLAKSQIPIPEIGAPARSAAQLANNN